MPRQDTSAILTPVPQVQFRSRVSPHRLTLEAVRGAVPPPRDIVQRRSRFVRDSSKVVEDVHLDRDRAEDLVLLPAVGEDPLLDDVLDDEFGLRASVRVSGRVPLGGAGSTNAESTHADGLAVWTALPRSSNAPISALASFVLLADKASDVSQPGNGRVGSRIDRSERFRPIEVDRRHASFVRGSSLVVVASGTIAAVVGSRRDCGPRRSGRGKRITIKGSRRSRIKVVEAGSARGKGAFALLE